MSARIEVVAHNIYYLNMYIKQFEIYISTQQSVDGNPYRRKEAELHSMLGVTTGENKKRNFIIQNAVYLELEISCLTWLEILSEIFR